MKFYFKSTTLILIALFIGACGDNDPTSKPIDTLKAYSIAAKQGDVPMMKKLISAQSLKLHEEQAKARNVSVDEILKTETLFPSSQKTFNFRNEKINGNNATVEVQNDYGEWETVYLVLEDGLWKIDKKGYAENIIKENEDAEKKMEDMMNQQRQETGEELDNIDAPDPNQLPTDVPPGASDPNAPLTPPPPASSTDSGMMPEKGIDPDRNG